MYGTPSHNISIRNRNRIAYGYARNIQTDAAAPVSAVGRYPYAANAFLRSDRTAAAATTTTTAAADGGDNATAAAATKAVTIIRHESVVVHW